MRQRQPEVQARALADHLGGTLHGEDCVVSGVCTLRRPRPGCLCFVKGHEAPAFADVPKSPPMCVLVRPALAGALPLPHIAVSDPRAAFARALTDFFAPKPAPGIDPSARIAPDASLGRDVAVGAYAVIGSGSEIGDHSTIGHHVVIAPGARIGRHCLFKSHSVIGEAGFGIAKDENLNNFRIPHIGGIEIGDHVEVGVSGTVCGGTVDATVIGDYVKMGNQVYVAHNVTIGTNTIVAPCSQVCGSARIGARVWLGAGCVIMNGADVGDDAVVGLGAVVTKGVEGGAVVAGNPARIIPKKP